MGANGGGFIQSLVPLRLWVTTVLQLLAVVTRGDFPHVGRDDEVIHDRLRVSIKH